MNNKYGKFFKKLSTGEISCFQYDIQNYYKLIREKQKEGFTQCIITSNIMIEIMQYFILRGNTDIVFIEFINENYEIKSEINSILELMSENLIYWYRLKEMILFFSQNNCNEIKKVEFKICDKFQYKFSILINGIFIISEIKFKDISDIICKLINFQLV